MDHFEEIFDDKNKKTKKPKEKKDEGVSKLKDGPKMKKPLRCWLCEGPHTVKNYPSKSKVVVVAQSDDEGNDASVGMMHILSAFATTEAVSMRDLERNKLEYVRMKVGGTNVLTMADSGASHNFMSEDTARRIGLKFVPARA